MARSCSPSSTRQKRTSERLVTRAILGLGVAIMATMAGGWLRLWGPWFHHGLLACGLLLLALRPPRLAAATASSWRKRHLFWALPGLALLLFYAAFPPTFYDALLYHLGVPGYYLQAGGFAPWPENIFSALPQNGEMLNLLLLAGGSVHGPKFLSLAAALALLLYLADWARASGLRHSWLAPLLFFSIPEVIFLAVTEKNDLLLMLFLLPAVRLLARLKDDPARLALLRGRRHFPGPGRRREMAGADLRRGVRRRLFFNGPSLAGQAPAARPADRHHRPAAGLPLAAQEPGDVRQPGAPLPERTFQRRRRSRGPGPADQRGRPPRPGIHARRHPLFLPRHVPRPILTGADPHHRHPGLLLLPLLFFGTGEPGRALLLLGCALGFLLLLAASRVPRYFLPLFMVLSLPLAAGWERLEEKLPRFRRLALLLLFALAAIQAVQAVSLLERMTLGARYAWGKLRHELPAGARYLDIIPYYPAIAFANRNLAPGCPHRIPGRRALVLLPAIIPGQLRL